jgi:hypothetical protein
MFKGQADRLHARLARSLAVTFLYIDMLGPQTQVAVVAVGCPHKFINDHPALAMGAGKTATALFVAPFLALFFIKIKMSIVVFHVTSLHKETSHLAGQLDSKAKAR